MLATLCVAIHPTLKQASPLQDSPPTSRATIEPDLPVAVDMRFVSVSQTGAGGSAHLAITLLTDTDVPELSMDLLLPEGLQVQDGTPVHRMKAALGAGERERHDVSLVAARNGVFPIRAEVTFRLPDGRSFRAGQGATLRLGAPSPQGRLNAGAYEVRGVPLEELQR